MIDDGRIGGVSAGALPRLYEYLDGDKNHWFLRGPAACFLDFNVVLFSRVVLPPSENPWLVFPRV